MWHIKFCLVIPPLLRLLKPHRTAAWASGRRYARNSHNPQRRHIGRSARIPQQRPQQQPIRSVTRPAPRAAAPTTARRATRTHNLYIPSCARYSPHSPAKTLASHRISHAFTGQFTVHCTQSEHHASIDAFAPLPTSLASAPERLPAQRAARGPYGKGQQ